MPTYEYIALDSQGSETIGTIEADSDSDATRQLRQNGLYPTKIIEQGKGGISASEKKKVNKSKSKGKAKAGTKVKKGKVKSKPVMIFTRQLATLIDSGLPLLRGLTVLGNQEPNPVLKGTIKSLEDSVQSGTTFSDSLAQHPKIFNKLYVNMVKAGELGGVLETVLNRLAEYQEKAQKLKNKIVAAMVYPVIVMFIAVAIMIFLLTVIVPKFEKIFEEMLPGGADALPGITKAVMGFSRFFTKPTFGVPNIGWIILAFLIIILLYRFISSTKGGRMNIDNIKLKLPLFGGIQRKSAISRFSRTLGTLVSSGVPILQALNITKDTAGNAVVAHNISKIHDAVKEGESIIQPMEAGKVFPPMVVSMVDVGEETGQLPEMLLKIADVYDDEVDNAVSALTSLLEPIMIVILAVVVGIIVMALFLPLIKIIQTVGQ